MQETFLHHVWQMQYFDKRALCTCDGEPIVIYQPGTLNPHAGPDFANARLKIGEIDWVGSVEIHINSSGWLEHNHDQDPAYDSVILHVVWKLDKEIFRKDQTQIPTLELSGRVEESLIRTYRQLIGSSFSVPCQKSLRDVEPITKTSMLEKAMMQRLERKAIEVQGMFERNANNWEETFFQLLARSFGFKVNAEPFLRLAGIAPLRLLMKHADRRGQLEALLFGQAGFLESQKGDDYYKKLQQEYGLLSYKYNLGNTKMSKSQWRFLRLRPANFPSLRMAQLAALLNTRHNLFSQMLEAETLETLNSLLTVQLSDYWMTHYHFSKTTRARLHELGKSSIEAVIINTVIPLWVAYGKRNDDQTFMDRALKCLEMLPVEVNAITKQWKDLGLPAQNSADSQALIELFNTFCQRKNCLNCTIGASLIRPKQNERHSNSHH